MSARLGRPMLILNRGRPSTEPGNSASRVGTSCGMRGSSRRAGLGDPWAAVGTATRGLTSTAGNCGRASGLESNSPMPRMMRGRGSRQTGTSAPVFCAALITRASPGARSLARARQRNAAAASDDPPPIPAATGNVFHKSKCPAARSGTSACSALAARRTRLSASSPASVAVGPDIEIERSSPGVKRSRSRGRANTTRLSSS